jgi:hypothetical protein
VAGEVPCRCNGTAVAPRSRLTGRAPYTDPGAGSASSWASTARFSTAPDDHFRYQVAAHIEGGAAHLTEGVDHAA